MERRRPTGEWPDSERPRERLLTEGPEVLTATDLLALLLATGSAARRETAVGTARRLLRDHGDLRRLAEVSVAELAGPQGLGLAKAARVAAACEIARRLVDDPWPRGVALRGAADVSRHFRRLVGLRKEVFYVVLLDAKNRKLRELRVSEGSLTASLVHPREVFRPALREAAAGLIVVHNHPSGDPAPSAEDRAITRRLREAGDLLGVRLLDHVIVGGRGYVSFAETGAL